MGSCPMCGGITDETDSQCPLCGVPLTGAEAQLEEASKTVEADVAELKLETKEEEVQPTQDTPAKEDSIQDEKPEMESVTNIEEPAPKVEKTPATPKKSTHPCFYCKKPGIRYIQEHKRWYCDPCKKYMPTTEQAKAEAKDQAQLAAKPEPAKAEAVKTAPAKTEPTPPQKSSHPCHYCKKPGIRYIQEHKRWYCDSCKKYMPTAEQAKAAAQATQQPRPTQQTAQQARPAQQQQSIQQASPARQQARPATPQRSSHQCHYCKKPGIRYIQDHKRWYCDSCKKYMPTAEQAKAAAQSRQQPRPTQQPAQQTRPAQQARPATPQRSSHQCHYCRRPGLRYIREHKRWYCDYCKKYMPSTQQAQVAPTVTQHDPQIPANNCSSCSRPLSFVTKHKKWYCYTCKQFRDPSPIISKKDAEEKMKESENKKAKKEEKKEVKKDEMEALEAGTNYLLFENKAKMAFELFAQLLDDDSNGLCITTTFPQKVTKKHNLKNAEMKWLSETSTDEEETINPKRLDFEVTRLISHYFKDLDNSVVLLDGLEYLLLENGFSKVIKFVKKINDISSLTTSTFIVVINKGSLKTEEMTMLQREFDVAKTVY